MSRLLKIILRLSRSSLFLYPFYRSYLSYLSGSCPISHGQADSRSRPLVRKQVNVKREKGLTGKGKLMKMFTKLSIAVFALVSIVHIVRLAIGWEIVIDGRIVPIGASYFGIIFPALLAFMVWKENFK